MSHFYRVTIEFEELGGTYQLDVLVGADSHGEARRRAVGVYGGKPVCSTPDCATVMPSGVARRVSGNGPRRLEPIRRAQG